MFDRPFALQHPADLKRCEARRRRPSSRSIAPLALQPAHLLKRPTLLPNKDRLLAVDHTFREADDLSDGHGEDQPPSVDVQDGLSIQGGRGIIGPVLDPDRCGILAAVRLEHEGDHDIEPLIPGRLPARIGHADSRRYTTPGVAG
jgi:hypothetical protein